MTYTGQRGCKKISISLPRDIFLNEHIRELTGDSLQSVDQLHKASESYAGLKDGFAEQPKLDRYIKWLRFVNID